MGLIALRKLCNHPDLLTGTPADAEDLTDDRDQDRDQDQDRAPADRPDQLGHWKRAGKMVVLSALLDIWRRQQHKVLLFTQSRQVSCGADYLSHSRGGGGGASAIWRGEREVLHGRCSHVCHLSLSLECVIVSGTNCIVIRALVCTVLPFNFVLLCSVGV